MDCCGGWGNRRNRDGTGPQALNFIYGGEERSLTRLRSFHLSGFDGMKGRGGTLEGAYLRATSAVPGVLPVWEWRRYDFR